MGRAAVGSGRGLHSIIDVDATAPCALGKTSRALTPGDGAPAARAGRVARSAIAREKHLDSLVGREAKLWAEIDDLVATKQPRSHDQAVKMLVDLRDLDARGKGGDFRLRIEALRQAQARKPSFVERLKKAGL